MYELNTFQIHIIGMTVVILKLSVKLMQALMLAGRGEGLEEPTTACLVIMSENFVWCLFLSIVNIWIIINFVGHSTMIGSRSKKVLGFKVKCKQCRKCDNALKNNKKPKSHMCAKNWTGSAKAMEPSMGVEMCKDLKGTKTIFKSNN